MLGAGTWDLDEEMLQTFARIFFGAMSSAGESVATAEDPIAAAARVEAAIGFIIAGFQSLADAGVELPATLAAEASGPLLREGDVAAVDRAPARSRCARPARSARRPWWTARSGPSRLSLVQVPRTSRPPWKISAWPLPSMNCVSGTGLPAGSR